MCVYMRVYRYAVDTFLMTRFSSRALPLEPSTRGIMHYVYYAHDRKFFDGHKLCTAFATNLHAVNFKTAVAYPSQNCDRYKCVYAPNEIVFYSYIVLLL